MPSNRKRQSSAGFATVVLSCLVVCLSAGTYLVGYIRLKTDLYRLYGDVNRLDRELTWLRGRNRELQARYDELTSQPALIERLKQLRLGLTTPRNDDRFVLREPDLEPPSSGGTGGR